MAGLNSFEYFKTERKTEYSKQQNSSAVLQQNSLKVKVKSSMPRSLQVENLLPQNVGSIINYFQ